MAADTPQQAAVLRRSTTARKVRARYPEGTRVRPRRDDHPELTTTGVVKRHIPMGDAQGGVLVVEWDNGVTGRMQPIGLEVDQ